MDKTSEQLKREVETLKDYMDASETSNSIIDNWNNGNRKDAIALAKKLKRQVFGVLIYVWTRNDHMEAYSFLCAYNNG